MDDDRRESAANSSASPERRSLLVSASTLAMAAGLTLGYGTCAALGGRFLYPARPRRQEWLYVARIDRLRPGDTMPYQAPNGERITVARMGDAGTAEDFIALGSTCPHLGCQVHWQGHRRRFYCPCHNGVFDPGGRALSGPPAEAGQNLPRYPLKVDAGLLYIEVPVEFLGRGAGAAAPPERAARSL